MKRGLVLSGGGRKGAFQVGVLDHLVRSRAIEFDWDFMAGTSVGAINVGFLAQATRGGLRDQVDDLVKRWSCFGTSDVWRPWFLGMAAGIWKEGFFNSTPLIEMLKADIDDARIQASGREVRYGVVNYGSGEYFEATERSTPQWAYVAASSSYPGGLLPVQLPEGLCGDGGAVSATPLKGAVDAGCEELDIVLCAPLVPKPMSVEDDWSGTRVSAVSIALRTVELLSHAAMVQDVKRLQQVNENIKAGRDTKRRVIKANVFYPKKHLTSGPLDALYFDRDRTLKLIEQGRGRAAELMG